MRLSLFLFFMLVPVASANPTTFPVFLKMGFSSVLDFDQPPVRVVLGDGQLFQVERMDRSLVLRATAPYATSNMFVYFRNEPPRMFILTASEDAEPTYYKSFASPKLKSPDEASIEKAVYRTGATRVLKAEFDRKKDYLLVELVLAAESRELLRPKWDWVRLTYNRSAITPDKLWSERKEIQRDSVDRVRLIFAKPNVPRNLDGVSVVIPLLGHSTPIHLSLGRKAR